MPWRVRRGGVERIGSGVFRVTAAWLPVSVAEGLVPHALNKENAPGSALCVFEWCLAGLIVAQYFVDVQEDFVDLFGPIGVRCVEIVEEVLNCCFQHDPLGFAAALCCLLEEVRCVFAFNSETHVSIVRPMVWVMATPREKNLTHSRNCGLIPSVSCRYGSDFCHPMLRQ